MKKQTDTDGYLLIERKNGFYEATVKGLGEYDVIEALGHCARAVADKYDYETPSVLKAIKNVVKIDEQINGGIKNER